MPENFVAGIFDDVLFGVDICSGLEVNDDGGGRSTGSLFGKLSLVNFDRPKFEASFFNRIFYEL